MKQAEIDQKKAKIKELEKQLAMADTVTRLRQNPDYQLLIAEGFCLHYATQQIQTSVNGNLNAEQRAKCVAAAQASGHLNEFLSSFVTAASRAKENIEALEEEIQYIMATPDSEYED